MMKEFVQVNWLLRTPKIYISQINRYQTKNNLFLDSIAKMNL
jgi:hypothetical protein